MRISTTTCSFFNPVELTSGEGGDYEFASSTCETITTGEATITSSSTNPLVYNGFTYGDIIISTFLFLIFMVGIFSAFWFGILKPHIHKIHKK